MITVWKRGTIQGHRQQRQQQHHHMQQRREEKRCLFCRLRKRSYRQLLHLFVLFLIQFIISSSGSSAIVFVAVAMSLTPKKISSLSSSSASLSMMTQQLSSSSLVDEPSSSTSSSSSSSNNKIDTNNDNNNNKYYNFLRGHPNKQLIPTKEIQTIMKKLSDKENFISIQNSLNYGDSQGNVNLRYELTKFINKHTIHDDYGDDYDNDHACDDDSNNNNNNNNNINDYFITNGVSHGIDLLCATQTNPNDIVYIEKPTYFLVSGIFHSHQLQIKHLPMKKMKIMKRDHDDEEEKDDENGEEDVVLLEIDVDKFIHDIECGIISQKPRLIYIIPTNQNPTSNTMSILNRIKLIKFANKHNILIIADEVYHLLDWKGNSNSNNNNRRPGRFAELNNRLHNNKHGNDDDDNDGSGGSVVTVSSFTKIFAPGIRCGWIEGPKDIINSLVEHGYINSQGGCTPFVGEIMYTSLQSGISDVVLNNLISSYQKRCEILYNSIMYNKENNNNDIIQEQEQQQQQRQRIIEVVSKPTGGYFMWIKFVISSDNNNNDAKKKPITIIDSEEFLQYCIDRKKPIKFMPGTRCDPLFDDNVEELITTTEKTTEEELSQYGRLCFADLDVSDLKEGATKLILCFKEYISYINNNTN